MAAIARPTSSPIAITPATEVGPCSAWPSRSGRDEARVGGAVGDDQHLGRPGQQVDPDAPEQLPLRLRDVGVAGADEHVDGRQLVDQPERERGECLHAAEADDGVGAGGPHRVQHRGVDPALALRGRDRDDALDAGRLCDEDRHERRGEHRVAAARHVRADGADGDVRVAEHDARQRLGAQVGQGRPLRLGERAHLPLRERDVLAQRGVQLRGRALELVRAEHEALRVPPVQLARPAADRLDAALLDVGEHQLDAVADLLRRRGRRRAGGLQVGGGAGAGGGADHGERLYIRIRTAATR
ncbi:hypothetical protein Q7L65_07735 [Conexibacter sp. CPCC 206217]|nr:hypothetical protein [Conexibacter sp. CPCC 206217]MDO8210291.1 hypothetical protein [Conexibacter sp. CPCC 206217]